MLQKTGFHKEAQRRREVHCTRFLGISASLCESEVQYVRAFGGNASTDSGFRFTGL